MGNVQSEQGLAKLNDKLQKHIVTMNKKGLSSKDEPLAYQLYECHTLYSESSKFFLHQKLFLRKPADEIFRRNIQNLNVLTDGITLSQYPYYIIPKFTVSNIEEDIPCLSRQLVHFTLEEKLQSGTPMSVHQKSYICIQILLAVFFLHELGLFHGNLKSSNVIITSDNIVFLTDFAPYKPIYFDESDFDKISLFYPDIHDKCYLSPERIDSKMAEQYKNIDYASIDNDLLDKLHKTDLFSVGCIIAEIFGTGKSMLNYKELLQMKREGLDLSVKLASIDSDEIKQIVSKMVAIDPYQRGTTMEALIHFRNYYGEEYFDIFLHLNYTLRRPEFSHPDIKLGLIRLLSPFLIQALGTIVDDEEAKALIDSIEFKCYFPYQISMVTILYQFRSIYQNCPIRKYFDIESIDNFLNSEILRIEASDGVVNPGEGSTTVLEHLECLRLGSFDYSSEKKIGSEYLNQERAVKDFSAESIIKTKLIEAKQRKDKQIKKIKLNSVHVILDTILSLMRNTQLDQSFRVGIELVWQYSRLIWDEQVIINVIPFISDFVLKSRRSTLSLIAMRLFCKLIDRIRYVPDDLANSSTFTVYIQPLRNYCLSGESQMLKILNAKNMLKFFELELCFDILGKRKIVSQKFSLEHEYQFDSLDFDATTDQILKFFKISKAEEILEIKGELLEIIVDMAKDNQCLTNLAPDLHMLEGYLRKNDIIKIIHVLKETILGSTDETLKVVCLRTIYGLIRRLPNTLICSLTKFVFKVVRSTTNLALICESLKCLGVLYSKISDDIITSRRILENVLVMILHPCLRVRSIASDLIKVILNSASPNEIRAYYSPVLRDYTVDRIDIDNYELFQLAKYDPITYIEYKKLERTALGKGDVLKNIKIHWQMFMNNFPLSNIGSSQKGRIEDFKITADPAQQSITNLIEEALGYTVIFEILEPYDDLKKRSRLEPSGEKYKDMISQVLFDNYTIAISPSWRLTKDNFRKLKRFKEEYFSKLMTVKGRVDKNYNLEVLRIIMNDLTLKFKQLELDLLSDFDDFTYTLEIPGSDLQKWRPSGILLSSINEHQSKVNSLANLHNSHFASGSSDGTVKIHNLTNIKKNFSHRSKGSIDLRKLSGNDDLEVNQLVYVTEQQKIAVFTNTTDLYLLDLEKEKYTTQKFVGKSVIRTGNLLEYTYATNCIGALTADSEFIVVDPRVAKPVQTCDLNKMRGVPSSITNLRNTSINVIGTYKGYLISQDLRANSCTNMRKLMSDDKQLPILSVSQYTPQSRFRNVSIDNELVTLTYPSSFNEFSVFCTNDFSANINPKLHFYSTKPESKSSIPILAPHLEDVTKSELFIDYDNQCQGKFSLFNDWELDENNNYFKLGNAFEVRSVDSIVNLYNQPFHENIIKVKQGWIKGFEGVMETLSSFSRFKSTIYKTVNLPVSLYDANEFRLDNIVIAGGSDKNIRFLNFGNSQTSSQLDLEHSGLYCYHVSNVDNECRKYEYANSGDVCLIKEVLVPSDNSKESFDVVIDPLTSERFYANGFSYYHNSFLHKKKDSHTLPGHTSTIRDLLVMKNGKDILVVSASDDYSIKIWN